MPNRVQAYYVDAFQLWGRTNAFPRTNAPRQAPLPDRCCRTVSLIGQTPRTNVPLVWYRTDSNNFQKCQRSPLGVCIPLICDCLIRDITFYSHTRILMCLCSTNYTVWYVTVIRLLMKSLAWLTLSIALLASRAGTILGKSSESVQSTCWRPVTHAQTWASYSAVYGFGSLSWVVNHNRQSLFTVVKAITAEVGSWRSVHHHHHHHKLY